MGRILAMVMFLSAVLVATPAALATQCVLSPLEDAVREAKHIFVGKVTDIRFQGDEKQVAKNQASGCGARLITFSIKRYFKGDGKPSTMIYSEDACMGLGVNFEKGREYLVYSLPNDHLYDETWAEVASLCFRTAPSDTPIAVKDMQQLSALFK